MTTLTITIDERTEADLHRLSATEGTDAVHVAARLLAHAVRAVRPRPVFDVEALKVAYTEQDAAEDLALSESTVSKHAALLAAEDAT